MRGLSMKNRVFSDYFRIFFAVLCEILSSPIRKNISPAGTRRLPAEKCGVAGDGMKEPLSLRLKLKWEKVDFLTAVRYNEL